MTATYKKSLPFSSSVLVLSYIWPVGVFPRGPLGRWVPREAAVINQGLVGGCYLWGLWPAPPLRSPLFTFGIEVSLRRMGPGSGRWEGWRRQQKQRLFELKAAPPPPSASSCSSLWSLSSFLALAWGLLHPSLISLSLSLSTDPLRGETLPVWGVQSPVPYPLLATAPPAYSQQWVSLRHLHRSPKREQNNKRVKKQTVIQTTRPVISHRCVSVF